MYYIRKASRDSSQPYTGPTCEQAGIEPGQWYETREKAEADAAKLAEHNGVGFKVEFKFNGSLPNLFQGFTVDQWFSHHPPRTEARKLEHGKADRAIRALAEELLLHANDVVKESAAEECTATIRTIQALPITIEWAANYIDEAREAIYIAENKARIEETISRLSQARQALHQGIALLELQQLGEANPEEVQLREEIRGKAPMPDAVRLELERARDEVREASAAVKAANQQSYIAVLERDTAAARIAELEERLKATLKPMDLGEYSARLEARVEELEERLKEPDEAEAYTKELEDRIEKLGDQDEEVKNLRYQLEVITTVLACVTPSPEEWSLVSVALADMRQSYS
jgi:hypothetical protein